MSFPITAPSKVFSDPTADTYQARVGRFRWYLQNVSKDLHGIFLVGADLEALKTATMPIWLGAQKVGIESDGVLDVHGADGQDKYLPMATAMQSAGSTIESSGVNDTSQAYMLKEAAVQGVTTVKVWDCTSACYSKRFLETAGAKAEGQYVDMPFVPVEEAKYSPAVKAYVKAVGDGVIDGNGEQAWAAALFFRDAVNAVVKSGGVNSLTRANFLAAAKDIHSFDADGMLATSDIPAKKATPVHLTVPGEERQVRAGVPEEAGDVRLQPEERRHREAVRQLTGADNRCARAVREGRAGHRREQEHREGHRARGGRERRGDLPDRALGRGRARAAREPEPHRSGDRGRAAAPPSPSRATTPTTRRSKPCSTGSTPSRAGSTWWSTSPRPTSPRWSACRSGTSRSSTSARASTSDHVRTTSPPRWRRGR